MNDRQSNDDNNSREFISGVIEGFYGKPWSFDQRKDLFKQLKKFNLNSFMYAPKDDNKHRSKWRQLYTDSEAAALKELIDEAKEYGIDFYYSLAPGLDITYSDEEEIKTLIKKFDQIVALGCKSFAILFDDIDPCIHGKDKEVFKNYASAQVSVANLIYEHLNKPKFLFCPTEYCESRAVPTVSTSIYLNTIGTGLHPDINFLWSGCRVISRQITEESIQELTNVIRRPPTIWENLHANDYDRKRVFLGPYSGRSTKIIPMLRGVLTNPNCEYEANYIAIHTLAQWLKCTEDLVLSVNGNQEKTTDNKTSNHYEPVSESIYDPMRALRRAIVDWLPRVLEQRSLPTGFDLSSHLRPRNDEAASNQLSKDSEDIEVRDEVEIEENNVEMLANEDDTQSSNKSNGTNKSDMDTSSSPLGPQAQANTTPLIDGNSCDSCEMQDTNFDTATKNNDATLVDCIMCATSGDGKNSSSYHLVDVDGLGLLVDLFYLPFEHGARGFALLNDIKWLIDNSDILINQNLKDQRNDKDTIMRDEGDLDENNAKLIKVWLERADSVNCFCAQISHLVDDMMHICPNKLLTSELYPYLADMRDLVAIITEHVKFLRFRTSRLDRFYNQNGARYKETASTDEQEPWCHRGGLIGDVHRLLY